MAQFAAGADLRDNMRPDVASLILARHEVEIRSLGDLFAGDRRFEFVPIRVLADAVNAEVPTVALPSFQRDAVWDERRVELLWDSLLRGFPIGSILLARGIDAPTRTLQRGRSERAKPTQKRRRRPGLVLIDGQQRAIGISMGFRAWREGDPTRLWIDLAGPLSDKDGTGFGVALCSLRHPWGLGATDARRRKALEDLGEEVTIDGTAPSLGRTWPLRAKSPVPLAAYMRRVMAGRADDWQDLLPRSPAGVVLVDASRAVAAAQVAEGLAGIDRCRVPALLLDELGSVDDLGIAFQRLNKQGVEMSGEDLFFSGLKLRWPEAHDLVWEIRGDQRVGRFLSPTSIVHIATRLTTTLHMKRGDVSRLDVDAFRTLVEGSGTGEAPKSGFLKGVQHYLKPPTGDSIGRLHRYLRLAREALAFRSGDPRDPGLPAPMLAAVRWPVWHALVGWIARRRLDRLQESERREMIRYALVDLFCVRQWSGAHNRLAFEVASTEVGGFPGKQIFEVLRADKTRESVRDLPSPAEFGALLRDSVAPRGDLLHNEKQLAMWVQRALVATWFPAFDPTMLATDDERPFDFDHILPTSHFERRGRGRDPVAERFYAWRDPLRHGAGNLRVWPKGANRGDGNRGLAGKHLVGGRDEPLPEDSPLRLTPMNLRTCGDVRAASFIAEEDAAVWSRVDRPAGRYHEWNDQERLDALREAVTRRRIAMYREMFTTVGFDRWLADVVGDDVSSTRWPEEHDGGAKGAESRAGMDNPTGVSDHETDG